MKILKNKTYKALKDTVDKSLELNLLQAEISENLKEQNEIQKKITKHTRNQGYAMIVLAACLVALLFLVTKENATIKRIIHE